jgi:hypothetical protein
VEIKSDTPVKKKENNPQPGIPFLGENKKQVVIIVRDEEAVYLRDEWLDFLSSILGACKLNLGDSAIINHAKTDFTFSELSAQLTPEFLILFEEPAQDMQLPVTLSYYQVQQYNHCSFLLSPSLQSMEGNDQAAKLEKSKLWLSLKKMFGISS